MSVSKTMKNAGARKEIASAMSESQQNVVISQPKIATVGFEIQGTAPLIQNNFSQKAVEEMLRKHMGLSTQREKKKPREVLEAATIYNTAGAICVPPTGIKKAMLTASTAIKSLKKTQLRTSLFIEGGSVPIKYERMDPRMDMVRTSGMSRTPDVRFRPMFIGWSARFVIQFSETALSVSTIVDLLSRAGAVGIGEWRPEKDGTFGTFRLARNITSPAEVAEVREACAPQLKPLVIPEWALDAEIDPMVLAGIMGQQSSASGADDDQETEERQEGAA